MSGGKSVLSSGYLVSSSSESGLSGGSWVMLTMSKMAYLIPFTAMKNAIPTPSQSQRSEIVCAMLVTFCAFASHCFLYCR